MSQLGYILAAVVFGMIAISFLIWNLVKSKPVASKEPEEAIQNAQLPEPEPVIEKRLRKAKLARPLKKAKKRPVKAKI